MSDISCEAENVSRYRPQSNQQHGQMAVHCDQINPQLTKRTIYPALNRLAPVLDKIKERELVFNHVRLVGAFGLVDESVSEEAPARFQRFGAGGYGGAYSVERRVPKVLPIGEWGLGKNIATLPAVQSIISGPEKGLLPQYNGRSEYVKSHDRPKVTRSYPTGRFKWGTSQNIARLPSVTVGGKYPVSNERSLSPQGLRDISRKTTSARISVQV